VSEKFFAETAPAASVTVTVKTVVASEAVGVPVMAPVPALNASPAGRVPPVSANPYGTVPPAAVTGVNDSGVPLLPVVDGTACVVVSAPFTVRSKVLADVAPIASVTVTVNVVSASGAKGVPVIAPVEVLNDIPGGSVPPDRAKLYGAVPPAAVTGTNDGIAVLCVPTRDAIACVVVSAELTVRLNVFDDAEPTASVAVTVNVVVARVPVGVPETAPVPVLNARPIPVSVAAGEMANVTGEVPPVAVTGTNDGIAIPTSPVRAAMAWVVLTPAAITSVKPFDDCVPAASVAVTVTSVGPKADAGVPVICPVTPLNTSPAGNTEARLKA
jgi:hypothetical protein